MKKPRISIIIPVYNRAKYIQELLGSLQRQTFSDFEVCIVDDGSTDNGKEIIFDFQKKDSRIKFFSVGENKGATFARNLGIQNANGEWIMLWDSDDLLYEYALETLVLYQNNFSEIDIFSAPADVFKKNIQLDVIARKEGVVTYEDILSRKLPQNSKVRIARAEIMKKVHYLSKNIDFLVNVQLVEKGKWFHIGKPLGLLRVEDDEMSLTKKRRKKNIGLSIERSIILEKFLYAHGEKLSSVAPSLFSAYAYGVSVGCLLDNNYSKSRFWAKSALSTHLTVKSFIIFILTYVPFGAFFLRLLFKLM